MSYSSSWCVCVPCVYSSSRITAQESCSEEESIRLTRYSSKSVGRLEVCVGGFWGTVCGNQATTAIVAVVCRQLFRDIRGRWLHSSYIIT